MRCCRLLAVLLVVGCGHVAKGDEVPRRQIYAHYMGCYPVGTGPTAHHRGRTHLIRHDAASREVSLGGRVRHWPLLPEQMRLTWKQSAELEIKRAMRIGIDGFAVDAWAGQDDARKSLSALFAAAEELDAPFYLTICLDPNCHRPAEPDGLLSAYEESLGWLLENHGDSRKLAHRKCDYKYIRFFDDGSDELYDLRHDESETTNLAAQKPEILNEHKGWLKNWIAEVRRESVYIPKFKNFKLTGNKTS